jgi:hypothetical protein
MVGPIALASSCGLWVWVPSSAAVGPRGGCGRVGTALLLLLLLPASCVLDAPCVIWGDSLVLPVQAWRGVTTGGPCMQLHCHTVSALPVCTHAVSWWGLQCGAALPCTDWLCLLGRHADAASNRQHPVAPVCQLCLPMCHVLQLCCLGCVCVTACNLVCLAVNSSVRQSSRGGTEGVDVGERGCVAVEAAHALRLCCHACCQPCAQRSRSWYTGDGAPVCWLLHSMLVSAIEFEYDTTKNLNGSNSCSFGWHYRLRAELGCLVLCVRHTYAHYAVPLRGQAFSFARPMMCGLIAVELFATLPAPVRPMLCGGNVAWFRKRKIRKGELLS